ncbi:MAG TPA: DinB family protein [Gemmataceae bacterium]|nr:DinB family protein [Gemmataceae bacterium]
MADLSLLARTALIEELEQLRDAVHEVTGPLSERALWSKPVEPGNSIGHLILHLTGNLNHFVGAQLGGSGYVRDREREFTEGQPPAKLALLANLDAAVATFRRVVQGLSAEQLAAPHPQSAFGSVLKALVHLVAHFALHRGQMSYLARLLKED